MKNVPLRPARIAFGSGPGDPPAAPDFGDIYHPQIGAAAQAQHVFLLGNGLPGRWRGRADFTVLETGFGLGHNFLALWQAWLDDPQRCKRLHVVSVERHPPLAADLARAHAGATDPRVSALLGAWPPLTPGLHVLAFEQARLRLTLALGDASRLLPALRLQADAVLLDGFAPDRNPEMWSLPLLKAVGRTCAPGATVATWSVARALRDGLATAGFVVERVPGVGGKREVLSGVYQPRTGQRRDAAGSPPAAPAPDAVVVGAGLAGAAAAQALARQGLRVTVLEQAAAPALGASGNPAGLFHGTHDADDSPRARLMRAAALRAAQVYREALANGVPGAVDGLLRTGAPPTPSLGEAPWTAAYLQTLDAGAASGLAGLPLADASWFYAGGGWIAPAAWVRQALAHPAIALNCGTQVAALQRGERAGWQLLDAQGRTLASSPLVVLASAEQVAPLLQPLGLAWPALRRTRGQITQWAADAPPPLRRPLAGDGYAIAGPWGWLCGATRQADDDDPALREDDHRYNLARFSRLTGLPAPEVHRCSGRVGWRLAADDRLPLAGPLPAPGAGAPRSLQCRHVPREPGLYVLTALGARGLTLAPLLGELIAAQASGTPWPLEQDLADAVDPARFAVRAARAG